MSYIRRCIFLQEKVMCSILGILDIKTDPALLRKQALRLSKLQRHRGPDWSGIYSSEKAILAHERLAIVDVLHGAQPLVNSAGNHILAVNGEIYNHIELRDQLNCDYKFQTLSDCEIILALYEEKGTAFLNDLIGIFAFVLYDSVEDRYLIGRDHIGIVPLYTGHDEHGNFYVASEMKALMPICRKVEEFPPGHILDSQNGKLEKYYQPAWEEYSADPGKYLPESELKPALEKSVKQQLMSDVPYGVLLSGGLDSSLISAIAQKYAARRVENQDESAAWWPQLHSFCIGLEGSPDLKAAREVAAFINTVHHEFTFTIQEGLDALSDVILHLETYDVTTIRAGTPMFLMARKIKAMGIKMVLSGEGADEIFGGYLYFHKAPDAREFHEENVRKLDRLHMFDCLRANKAMAAWGVEVRVPFLDQEFLEVAMHLNPELKMIDSDHIEKDILRRNFKGYLPESVLWRQKEQFSDGVGYSWIDSLKDHAENIVSDKELANAHFRFPHNTPNSKEAYLYRALFDEHFPLTSAAECIPGGDSVACSTPEALAWDKAWAELADPSGRAVKGVHSDSY